MARRSLVIRERSFGSDDPLTACSLDSLALLLKDANQLNEAETMCRKCIDIRCCTKSTAVFSGPIMQGMHGSVKSASVLLCFPTVSIQATGLCLLHSFFLALPLLPHIRDSKIDYIDSRLVLTVLVAPLLRGLHVTAGTVQYVAGNRS